MTDEVKQRTVYHGRAKITRTDNRGDAPKKETIDTGILIRELPGGRQRVRVRGLGVGHIDVDESGSFEDQPWATTTPTGQADLFRVRGIVERIPEELVDADNKHMKGRFEGTNDTGTITIEGTFDAKKRR